MPGIKETQEVIDAVAELVVKAVERSKQDDSIGLLGWVLFLINAGTSETIRAGLEGIHLVGEELSDLDLVEIGQLIESVGAKIKEQAAPAA